MKASIIEFVLILAITVTFAAYVTDKAVTYIEAQTSAITEKLGGLR
jgi:hypothetical protein